MKKFSSLLLKTTLLSFFFLTVAPVALTAVSANEAMAQSNSTATTGAVETQDENVLTRTMCRALRVITGSAGKAFAAFAIISIGIGFFTGKVSWGLMIGVAAGIAAMFGAPSIVSAITGKEVFECGTPTKAL